MRLTLVFPSKYGNQVRVLPHSDVLTDGKIIDDITEIYESILTGEAMSVLKKVSDPIVTRTGPSMATAPFSSSLSDSQATIQ